MADNSPFDEIVERFHAQRPTPTKQEPNYDLLVRKYIAVENSLVLPIDINTAILSLRELGEVLRQRCWDLRLPDLLEEASVDDNVYEYAIQLLQLACEQDVSSDRLTQALHLVNNTPELRNVQEQIHEVGRQLDKLEKKEGPPWTPRLNGESFFDALKGVRTERGIKHALESGSWISDPPWTHKFARHRRYRSKDGDEQRMILKHVRRFLGTLGTM